MKNVAKIMTFKLSVLTTLMLCVTASNYASDIEIYKAPNAADGKARVMLNLDNSGFMSGKPGAFSGNSTSIKEDYGNGITCPSNEKYYTQSREFIDVNGKTYRNDEYYCTTPAPVASNNRNLNKAAIEANCDEVYSSTGVLSSYKCLDRSSMVRRSLYALVNSRELGADVSIGISTFPAWRGLVDLPRRPIALGGWYKADTVDSSKLVLCPADNTAGCKIGRDILNEKIQAIAPPIDDVNETKKVPVAKGYSVAAKYLLTNESGGDLTADQCSGYGIFTLTSGLPAHEEIATAASNIKSVLQAGTSLLDQCDSDGSFGEGSWKCIGRAADVLAAGKAKISMPVKSAVVSYGSGFSFTPDLSPYDPKLSTIQQIQKVTNENSIAADSNQKALYANKGYAAISGVRGNGGYYSVDNPDALTDTIKSFIADVAKADIPFITTGAPTIPQDPLNPVLVQSNAYFTQFKPTPMTSPTDGSNLWVGNLKKYHMNSLGRLIGKNNSVIGTVEEKEAVTDDLGRLITGTHDYWAPAVSTDVTISNGDETVWGSELYARMGGVKSQLPIATLDAIGNIALDNRKLLTNRVVNGSGVASESTTLSQINSATWAANDAKHSDIMSLFKLRQVGAVMHSSPLLLSNAGKVGYDANNKVVTSNREDYVLFGTTQGILHVVKADDYSSATQGGREVFAFVPHEMIERQSKAFLNPDQTPGGTANLFYGIDAPWTAYTEYVPKSDTDSTLTVGTGKTVIDDKTSETLQGKQLVYGGLRMGGRSYYALDLKNMNSPQLKFHINPDAALAGTPLSYMGESWSKPKIAWVNWNGSRKLVMFVGGGYDAGGVPATTPPTTNAGLGSKNNNGGYELDNYNQTNRIGAGVYMFDALNGDLLWWASDNASVGPTTATNGIPATENSGVIALKDPNLKYSVVSEIKTADRNNDGLVDHLYFGDLGGQVFRIDLNNNTAKIGEFATRSTRILNMQNATAGHSPRFYAAPSFAIFKDSESGKLFAAISIGSGNLSHPLAGYDSGRNYDALYTIYDKDVTKANLYSSSAVLDTYDTSVGNSTAALALHEITLADRFQQTADQMAAPIAPYASSSGWYYRLTGGSKIQNEKIFYTPSVIDYDLYVSSYDSSRLGLTGTCGGGVQGVSKVQLFCMPFGQCSAADYPDRTTSNYSDEHGPGIQNHAIASGGDGTTRLIGGAIIGNNLNDQYKTLIKLIPQRWYEK